MWLFEGSRSRPGVASRQYSDKWPLDSVFLARRLLDARQPWGEPLIRPRRGQADGMDSPCLRRSAALIPRSRADGVQHRAAAGHRNYLGQLQYLDVCDRFLPHSETAEQVAWRAPVRLVKT